MRRSKSPSQSRRFDLKSRVKQEEVYQMNNHQAKNLKCFCHFNNAVYMGGMNSYKKHGRGLLLHDDGSAVITQYLHDTLTGHNIIFRQNSIASVLFKKNGDYQIAYKVSKCIVKIPFNQGSQRAHGRGVFIDYEIQKVFKLQFINGTLVEKILILEREINKQIFTANTITKAIGMKHEQAFQLTFEKPSDMHVKYDKDKLTIGYFDDDGEIHGLAFKMNALNANVAGYKALQLKLSERGYYRLSKLETFGEKQFSNGNRYIGQFQKGQFHGRGILICPTEMKWVYGRFQNHKLQQVIDSNNSKFTNNNFERWQQNLKKIHQRYQQRWIDLNIYLPEQLYLYNVLKQVLKKDVTKIDPDLELVMREDFQRMSLIQKQFQEGLPGSQNNSYVQQELDKHYIVKTKYGRKDQEITPINQLKKGLWEGDPQIQFEIDEQFNSRQPQKRTPVYKQHQIKNPFERDLPKINPKYIFPQDTINDLYQSKYRQDEDTQPYNYNAKNMRLSSSPVHRNYLKTPPKEHLFPQKSAGHISNKRMFNYKDPAQLIVHRWMQNKPRQIEQYFSGHEDKRHQNSMPIRSSPERKSPGRNFLRNQESTSPTKNFIKNNYSHW